MSKKATGQNSRQLEFSYGSTAASTAREGFIDLYALRRTVFNKRWIETMPAVLFNVSKKPFNDAFPTALWLYTTACDPHVTMLRKKAQFVVGNGLRWSPNEYLTNFFNYCVDFDPHINHINELLYKLAYDLELYNSFSFYVGYSASDYIETDAQGNILTDENGDIILSQRGRRIVALGYLDNQQVRLGIPDKYGDITTVWVSRDFLNYYQRFNQPVQYPIFDGDAARDDVEVFNFMQMREGANWYPIPSYFPAINDILVDSLIKRWRVNTLQNGFSAGTFVLYPYQVPEALREKEEKNFVNNFTGVGNAGKVVSLYGMAPAGGTPVAPEVTRISASDDVGIYDATSRDTIIRIINAHEIAPALAGYNTEGKLTSDGNTIRQAAQLFEALYAPTRRNSLLGALKKVLYFNQQEVGTLVLPTEAIESLRFEPIDFNALIPETV